MSEQMLQLHDLESKLYNNCPVRYYLFRLNSSCGNNCRSFNVRIKHRENGHAAPPRSLSRNEIATSHEPRSYIRFVLRFLEPS